MTDDPTSLKGIASLRHMFPTLWYFIADSKRLIEPIRNLSFDGITRPWAYAGACITFYGMFHSFAQKHLPDPSILLVGLSIHWTHGDTVDLWLMLFLPFCAFYWHALSQTKHSPSFASVVAVFLYIFGAYAISLFILDFFVFMGKKPNEELPLYMTAIKFVVIAYLLFVRSALVLVEFEQAETDIDIENVWANVSSAAGRAILVFLALAVFTAEVIEWSPGRFLDQILNEK